MASVNVSMLGVTYRATGAQSNIASYTNNNSYKVNVNSITLRLGTGNGTFTDGNYMIGNGGTITTYVQANGYQSNSVNITNPVGATGSPSYPIFSQCTEYTFTFSTPPQVASGETITFTIQEPATPQGTSGLVLVAHSYPSGNSNGSVNVSEVISAVTLTYNANGGSGAPSAQTLTPGVAGTLSSTKPTRSGCTFLGWSTSSTATSASYSAGGSITINSNTTLYAVWKIITYTVSYDANGGSGAPSNQTKTHGQSLTLSSTKPTWSGHSFKGWATSASATSATYQPSGSFTTDANTTLYAVWDIITYTVSYNANGGSGAPSSQVKTHGVNLTLSSTRPTRSGYNFKGWGTSASATSATYQPGGTYSANESATLYAIWKAVYTITYNANGGNKTPSADSNIETGSTILLPYLNANTVGSKGYTITYNANGGSVSTTSKVVNDTPIKWNTNSSGTGTEYSGGGSYTVTNNATLYVKWSHNTIGALPTPTYTNCKFLGWFTSASGGTQVTTSTVVSSNMTIYAHWEYGITYNFKGGSLTEGGSAASNITEYKTYGVDYTIKSSYYPYKTNSFFVGWDTNSSGSTVRYASGAKYTSNAPVTLYAVYNTPSYTVKFVDGYSGATLKTQTVSHGSSATPPADPVRAGYKFMGWSGNYENVKMNSTVQALWGFGLVWVYYKSKGWIPYEPEE